ncbi:MAG: hypothetical protein OXN17_14705 [Candidatus Poribacteria bacterium]|nr:hypothetical protein [Candidatus Poribacteria bacterium]
MESEQDRLWDLYRGNTYRSIADTVFIHLTDRDPMSRAKPNILYSSFSCRRQSLVTDSYFTITIRLAAE